MTIGLHLDDTDITCTTLHLSLGIATVYIIPWSWCTLYSLSDNDVLDTDSWSCYIESHTILHLHWLMKLTKSGLLRETGSRENQGGMLGRATLVGLDATRKLVFLWFMHTPVITCYMIPKYSELSLCYQDPLTHHLFDMQLSCRMGHKMVALV